MKITDLAFAGNIGGFGAIGLANFLMALWVPSAADARLKNPSRSSSPVRASPANPPPASHRNSRRVRPQNWRERVLVIAPPSVSFPRSHAPRGDARPDAPRPCFRNHRRAVEDPSPRGAWERGIVGP